MKLQWPRFSIERLRNVVLVGGVFLIAAVIAFLFAGQWRRRLLTQDLPRRLGANIELEANGFNYTQTSKGKTLFKIHAERAEQMKQNARTLLHNVRIEMYGADSTQTDTITGRQFEYDQAAGKAVALGEVQIDLVRPVNPTAGRAAGAGADKSSQNNTIHLRTSGLEFNQRSGIATTTQRVDFSLERGSGNSIGATYDSNRGDLVLDRDVAISVRRPNENLLVHASHAEFERAHQLCHLLAMTASDAGGTATSGVAVIHFRADGSLAQLDGSDTLRLTNPSGAVITAPQGSMIFDSQSHPTHGVLRGGTSFSLHQPGRNVEGSAPTAQLAFDSLGRLHRTHLERGVVLTSQQQTIPGKSMETRRRWTSEIADLDFVPVVASSGPAHAARSATPGASQPVALRTIHGTGSVVITSEGDPKANGPTRMAADDVVAELTPDSKLSRLTGDGHAQFEQSTKDGAHQVTNSDHLEARFTPQTRAPAANAGESAQSIESILQTGHVALTNTPGPAPTQQLPLHATAARADYDGLKQTLHLSGSSNQPPRVSSDTFSMSATTIDLLRLSGDLFGHQNVRASWSGSLTGSATGESALRAGKSPGQGDPVYAVASELALHRDSQQMVLLGAPSNPARLWQAANSVTAPQITLNRKLQTLDANGESRANPVSALLANTRSDARPSPRKPTRAIASARPGTSPDTHRAAIADTSVMRLTSGELHYSEGQRLATFSRATWGPVAAETSTSDGIARILSDSAQVYLLDPDTHASSAGSQANATVDRMVSQGHVAVRLPGRVGTGDKLVYTGDDGLFTLTGSAANPPRIRDQQHGTVTGNALIFNSQDDSVTVEGNGAATTTNTRTPR